MDTTPVRVRRAGEPGAGDRPEVALRADRRQVAKRLWRGRADDGREFEFDLEAPLRDGDCLADDGEVRYRLRQQPEPVLAVSLALAPSAAAGIGWAAGNLHLEMSAEADRVLLPDEPAARGLLGRLGLAFEATTAVFRPGRFVRGAQSADELGAGHRH